MSVDDDHTYVYFVQPVDGGLVKIGQSRDPQDRFLKLQTGSPVLLRLCSFHLGHRTVEHRLHLLFSAYRQHGEWFRCCPMLAALSGAIAEPGLTDDLLTPDKEPAESGAHMFRSLEPHEHRPIASVVEPAPDTRTDVERVEHAGSLREPLTALPDDVDPHWHWPKAA